VLAALFDVTTRGYSMGTDDPMTDETDNERPDVLARDPIDSGLSGSGEIEVLAHEPQDSEEPSAALAPKPEIFDISCSIGVSTRFRLPVTAPFWHARVHFYRPNTTLLVKSSVIDFPRSYYAGSVVRAKWSGALPRGMGSVRAFWWYGETTAEGPIYGSDHHRLSC
jgi:hypothetical protein